MKKILLTGFLLSIGIISFGQSDDPCGAPVLTTGTSCTYTAGDLPATATATTGVPAPGCASYNGQDVWFQVTVPATGTLTIDLNTAGGPTDMGMAWYTGSCSSLTLSACNDDASINGLMPMIAQTGLNPGDVIFVRIWEYGGNATGAFSLCAYAPAPPTPCIGGSNNSCSTADPFCTGAPVTYCNSTGIPSMGTYACLYSTPNPMWMYMEISTPGPLDYTISQTNNSGTPIDVDFALYGPFTSISNACAAIGPGTATVDCSYSGSATETANIANAQIGEFYMMLVTNYNGSNGSIVMNQTGGAGATNCSLIVPCTVSATAVSDTCSSGFGSVTATILQGTAPYTYDWTTLGNQSSATVTGVTAGTHSVTLTTGDGCVATATVVVPNYTPTATNSSTLVSCAGGSDGTVSATMTPALGTVSYSWNDANNQSTQTATGLPAGSYTCTLTSSMGCSVTTTATVTEIPGITSTIVNQQNVTCNSGNDGIIQVLNTLGTAPYSYSWDSSSSTTELANDLTVGPHTVTITDALGCVITTTATLTEPAPLSISFITPDSTICPENSIVLNVTGAGGSSPYFYSWTENNIPISTSQTPTVNPTFDNTQYCVTLSEACGSPTTTACMFTHFPTPIVPTIDPDKPKDCAPATFTFINNSNNGNEIATTFFTLGNGIDTLIIGNDSVTSYYPTPGQYDLDVIITSIYGCVYTGSFSNIVESIELPTASFGIAPNPTTYFETTVEMQNNSTPDVTNWEWYAPDATPTTSTDENAVMTFPIGVTGQYPVQLIVITADGCRDTTSELLTVNTPLLFYAPNTFTPNGDEFNQTWKFVIDGIDIYDFEIQIFNRWGEMVWQSFDPSVGWDGTYGGEICPDGFYNWKVFVKDSNTDFRKEYSGSLSIMR